MTDDCRRSPGGTPFRMQRDPADFDCSDPAALIARALKKKFAAQRRNCDSPDAGKTCNDSPVSGTAGDRSDCWSPSPAAADDEPKPPPVYGAACLPLSLHVRHSLTHMSDVCLTVPFCRTTLH